MAVYSSGSSGVSAPAHAPPASASRGGLLRQEMILGWLLLAAALLVMIGLVIYPFTTAIWMSFTEKSIGRDGTFIGLTNFSAVPANPRVLLALRHSLIFTVVSLSIKFTLGMALALVLNRAFRRRNIVRAFLLVPWVLPAFVAYMTWRWCLDP